MPKNEYSLIRNLTRSDSFLETTFEGNSRYCLKRGFIFHRTNDDFNNNYSDNLNEIVVKEDILKYLNDQISTYNVFFYDHSYVFLNKYATICEGKIFSPQIGLDDANGFYFLKREKTPYNGSTSREAYYLLYYSFELDYEIAKAEFEKISRYIHCVNDGRLN